MLLGRCKSIVKTLGSSGGVPGASREHPERPQNASGCQKERPGRSRSTPRKQKSTPSRFQKPKNHFFSTQLVRVSSSERSFIEFARFSVCPQSLRTLESSAPASKNRGSALCAASRAVHAMTPRKMTKINPGIDNFRCIWPQGGIGFCCFGRIRHPSAAQVAQVSPG